MLRKRTEGIWNGAASCVVAMQYPLVEEQGTGIDLPLFIPKSQVRKKGREKWYAPIQRDHLWTTQETWVDWPVIPEVQRVERNEILVNAEEERLELTFWMSDGQGNEPTEARVINVHW